MPIIEQVRFLFALFIPIVLANVLGATPIPEEEIPAEVKAFIEEGTHLIAIGQADLNKDRRSDYILVSEREVEAGQRALLILVRQDSGHLALVKRNEKIILCATCGGVWGDPFERLVVKANTFTVAHYGGSNWRWATRFTFNYSRRDRSWQLVRAEETEFFTGDPEQTTKTKVRKPSKDFGKIDIADFDPDKYRGVGEK